MSGTLDKIVPWGRSLDEYRRMFDLSKADLDSAILDCAAGPSSFNAEMQRQNRRVVSCDPIFQLSAETIRAEIEKTFPEILASARKNSKNFSWLQIRSPEELGELRLKAMNKFLADFPRGKVEGRYIPAALPSLPFRDQQFDIALCSHFLFTSTNALSADFHLAALCEMCRVAGEVRVFPLVPSFETHRSPYVSIVLDELRSSEFSCEIRKVPYEFQTGANEMLVLSSLSRPTRAGRLPHTPIPR